MSPIQQVGTGQIDDRWNLIDLGLINTLLTLLFKNVSKRVCGILTILASILISITDTISDFAIAIALFAGNHTTMAWVVITVDYTPSWTLALHNYFSPKWRAAETIKQKLFTMMCLLLSPFSQALFHIRWLFNFEKSDPEEFALLHHNARLSQLLSGS